MFTNDEHAARPRAGSRLNCKNSVKNQAGLRFFDSGPKAYQTSPNFASRYHWPINAAPKIIRTRSDKTMNSLRNMSISRRLWMILIVAVL
ncbi:MAG: hypothetical protein ACRC1I_19055, partial [Pseudomonas proteolytica]|uniref:hypothetical protein n=1 Tax=Pseudomonas proteolytica TaxID=219574 RepID=UPI003F30D6A7